MNKISRSLFVKTMFTGAIALQLPFVFSCNSRNIKDVELSIDDELYKVNIDDLRVILDVLLPDSSEGPGALSFKAEVYFMWFIADDRLGVKKRTRLIKGITMMKKFAKTNFGTSLQEMTKEALDEFMQAVTMTNWGENLLSSYLTVCFEAMFANPVYGSNPDYIGWKWLNYEGGMPQPNKNNKYPEILSLAK